MTDDTTVNVLLVDDDAFLTSMYAAKFTHAGFTVEACLNAKQALEVLRAGFVPAAILFDIVMPDMDGFSFMKALITEHLGTSAIKIALTNQSGDSEKRRADELGVDRFIVKAAMIPSEVVDAVQEELAKRKK